MSSIRLRLLPLLLLSLTTPVFAGGSSGSTQSSHGAAERQAYESFAEVRKLVLQQSYFGGSKGITAPFPDVSHLRDTAARVAAYRVATDGLVAQLKAHDRWTLIEEPKAMATRTAPPPRNVPAHRAPGDVAIVKIRRFRGPVGDAVQSALAGLKAEGPVRGLVLDLRSNGGGLINEAVALLSQFLPKQQPLFEQAFGPASSPYRVTPIMHDARFEPDLKTPIAVLVNGATASSSEITTGVLKDLRRARIFGEPTYGKGVGQLTRTLPDGRSFQQTELALKLPVTGTYHGIQLAPHETVASTTARVATDGRVRPRGDQLMRGALLYLWDQQAVVTNAN